MEDTTRAKAPTGRLGRPFSRARFLREGLGLAGLAALAACAPAAAPTAAPPTAAPAPTAAPPAKPTEAPSAAKPAAAEPTKPAAAEPTKPAAAAEPTKPAAAAAPTAAAAQAPAKSSVTLNFLDVIVSDELTKQADQIIADFTKTTGIAVKVDKTPFPQFGEKVPTLLSSGAALDVWWSDTQRYPEFVKKNWMTPLDELIAGGKTLKKAEIQPFAWDKAIYGGKIYGVPKDWSARGGYYNKEILQRQGIKVPETVAELKAAALKVKANDPQLFGYMWPMKTPETWMPEGLAYIMLANDGAVLSDDASKCTFNSEAVEESMAFFVDIWKARAAPEQGISSTNQDLYPLFGSGKVAFMHTGFFAIKAVLANMEVKDKYDTFVVKGRNGNYGTMVSISTFSIPTPSKAKSEAYELIQWVVKSENVAAFTTNPSARSADAPENKARFDDPRYKPFFLAAEKGGKWMVQPNPGIGDQLRIVLQESQAIVLGQKSIKQGLADATTAIEKTLGK
jgi:ABC-type glycerol-3-phosphate transport system substrate-binding protein